MEIDLAGKAIKLDRELSGLDKLVLRFTTMMNSCEIDYVIISGYIAILFGRSRNTEDVDIFIEEMGFGKFEKFWNRLIEDGFYCIGADSAKMAFYDYLKGNLALRFALNGEFIPNFEVKFPKSKYNRYSMDNKIKVMLDEGRINTSELELQIAFKLHLGSEKDFEDARHLFKVFEEHLDIPLLKNQISELGVEKQAEMILWKEKV